MESFPDENDSTQDSERNEIRSELSKMTFEELQKLKAKLGQKVYRETMYGTKTRKTEFKRKNKNRPREASSKIKPTVKTKTKQKEQPIVDPRFNRLCGTFNEKHFQNTYDFLTDIRKREKLELKKLLKKENNPEEVSKIKYLLQRMNNQEREAAKKQKEKEKKLKEREEQIKALESGKKPYFRTKYENKIANIVEKYEELKKKGKVQKYIEKKQKKQNVKEKRKRYFEVNISDENK